MNIREKLEPIINSGNLLDLKLYQVNDYFFQLPEKGLWIVDGGVELCFPKGVISLAFNSEKECLQISDQAVSRLYQNSDIFELYNEQISDLKQFVGVKVEDFTLKTIEFESIIDYTMKTNTI